MQIYKKFLHRVFVAFTISLSSRESSFMRLDSENDRYYRAMFRTIYYVDQNTRYKNWSDTNEAPSRNFSPFVPARPCADNHGQFMRHDSCIRFGETIR